MNKNGCVPERGAPKAEAPRSTVALHAALCLLNLFHYGEMYRKFTQVYHLRWYSPVAFSAFTLSCSPYRHPSPELLRLPTPDTLSPLNTHSPFPLPPHPPSCFVPLGICLFRGPNVSELTQYLSFRDRLLSLSAVSSEVIHVTAAVRMSSLLKAE